MQQRHQILLVLALVSLLLCTVSTEEIETIQLGSTLYGKIGDTTVWTSVETASSYNQIGCLTIEYTYPKTIKRSEVNTTVVNGYGRYHIWKFANRTSDDSQVVFGNSFLTFKGDEYLGYPSQGLTVRRDSTSNYEQWERVIPISFRVKDVYSPGDTTIYTNGRADLLDGKYGNLLSWCTSGSSSGVLTIIDDVRDEPGQDHETDVKQLTTQ